MRKSVHFGCFRSLLVFLAFNLLFFTSCEIGLGSSVDTEVPSIDFASDSVESGSVVRDAFALHGSFNDDGEISSISSNLISLTSGTSYKRQGEIDAAGKKWKVTYDPVSENIPDGTYDIHISVKDSANHETKISRSFIIDNTAPIVVLSRPSTKLGATLSSGVLSFDSYGQKFTLEGKAADDNDVSLIEVEVYDNEDCTGEPYVISLPNVPLTIESDVATFAENISNDYSQIYGHTTKSGDERRYCKLIVYDGAQRYPADGSAQTDADRKGNSVDYYYLNSDVSTLFSDGYKITELYHILNGTYSPSSSSSRSVSTSSVMTDYLNNASKKTNVGQFNLNPENSPTFVVSARNPLSSESDDFTSQTITNGNSRLEVEVSPGLDGDLLEEESIGVYLIRCNEAGQPVDSSNNVISESSVAENDKIWLIRTGSAGHAADADITVSGSVYKFKTKQNIGNSAYSSLVVGAYYLIRVVGHDSHNDIMNVGDDTHRTGKYGFKLETAGETINLSSVSFVPSSKTIYTWKTFTDQPENAEFHTIKNSLSFSGGSGVYSVFRKFDSNEYTTPISTGITGTGYSTDTNSTNISLSSTVKPSKIYYYVKDNANLNSNERSIDISYDNTPPVVPVADIEYPDVQATQLRRISFSGSVSDTAPAGEVSSEVKSVFVQISGGTISTPDYGQDNALMANLGGDEWSIQVDTAASAYASVFEEDGYKTISVVARDGVKLKSVPATKTFMYDTSVPAFSVSGVTAKTTANNTVISGSYIKENFRLEATAEDRNAIDSVYVSIPKTFPSQPEGWPTNYYTDAECTIAATSFDASTTYYFKYNSTTTVTTSPVKNAMYSTSFAVGSSNSSAANYLADGNYTFYMTVKDIAGKTHSISKTFTVDTILPEITAVTINGEAITKDADNSSAWYRKQTIPLIINASDANISSVECQTLGAAESTLTEAGWTPLNLDSGLYKGSAVFNGNGSGQKLYIRAKDNAGNINSFNTDNAPVIINIDTDAPELTTLFYQVGSGTLTEAGATVYTNGTAAITVYGNYKAENSGVQALTCNLINGNTTTPISATVTYSTTEITGLTNIPAASAWTSLPTTDAGKKAIRSYKMVFTTSTSGKLEITGYNGTYVAPAAGQTASGGKTTIKPFTITPDGTAPNLKNIRLLIDATNDTDAYKKTVTTSSGSEERYYINNDTSRALTIFGVATDNIGVDTVNLSITGLAATATPSNTGTASEWKFENIDLHTLSGHTTATVNVTDVAGNSFTSDLIIYFDTTGPAGFHEIDSSSKDLNFRIGDADNDDITTSSISPAWNNSLDTDVGGKYSDGTYGNNSTIKIRGTINDSDSGVNMIYYYVFDKPVVIRAGCPDKESITDGTVPSYGFASNDKLRDYVINNKTGFFAPSAEETKRVFYNVSGTASLSGTQFTSTADEDGYYKYYKNVKTNYNSTISGLTHDKNYLVIAAVDNVGNKGLDTATVGSEEKKYCQINVDTGIPDIALDEDQEAIRYSNAGADITFTGRATDSGAGVKSVSFTVNGHEISSSASSWGSVTLSTSGSNTKNNAGWTLVVKKEALTGAAGNISVYGTVKDGAGAGNSQTLSVATIIMDTTPPSVSLSSPKDADSSEDGIQVNGTISLSGTASDKNGLFAETTTTSGGISTTTKNMKLYYTTLSSLNISLTNALAAYAASPSTTAYPSITAGTNAASAWKEIGTASHDTSWIFTGINTAQLDGPTAAAIADGTTVYLTVAVKDAAGNTGYSTPVTVEIDQNTDRPKVSFSNLELGSTMTSASDGYIWLKNTTKIIGTISDDDDDETGANILQISLDGTNWNPVTLNGSSFSYDLKGLYTGSDTEKETQANGNKTVYFKVTDKKGKAFTSAAANTTSALYLSDGTDTYGGESSGAKAGSIVYVTVDTKYPEVVLQGAKLASSADGFVENYSSIKLGGTNTSFIVKFTANDTNGIDNNTVTGTAELPYGTSTDKVSVNHSAIVQPTTDNPYYTMTFSLSAADLTTLKAGDGYDGSVNIRISASDTAGNATAQTATLAYDFKPSLVSFSSPASSATLSGDIQAYGSLTESAAVYYSVSPSQTVSAGGSVSSWLDGEGHSANLSTATTVEDWQEISDAALSWTINFDNLINSTSGTHSKSLNKYLIDYGIAPQDTNSEAIDSIVASFNNFVRLYLWIKTVDGAGNEKIAVHPILVDPQGDRPSLQFSYPSVNNGTMGGKVSVYGTATDTKGSENKIGVDSVWVQIKSTTHRAAENTSTYGDSPEYTEATDSVSMTLTSADLDYMAANGYSVYKMSTYNAASPASNTSWVSGTSSLASDETAADYAALANLNGAAWDIDINKNVISGRSEFDPPSGIEKNPVVIRVFARDGDGKFSLKADRYVSFDADTPIISELKLVQSSGAGITAAASATKTYSADMYVKGVWYLTGTATDKDAIKKVTIGSDVIVDNGVVQTGWTDKVKLYNASNTEVTSYGTTVKFKYELTPASGIGSKTPVIAVTDNASPQSHTGSENIVVKYDNDAPVLATTAVEGLNINSSIYQDNSWYTFGSKASEAAAADGTAQSGFAYSVFYFVRNNTVTSTKTLFDVLNPRASSSINITGDKFYTSATDTTGTVIRALGSETATADNTIVTDSGLYWYRKAIVANSISGQTFRVNDISGIRASSLVKIDGAFYLVTEVDTGSKTITVDATLPSATASVAYAAIAGVVNNTIPEGEGSVIQSDGYYDSPSRDDGDRMIESVTNTGTTWKWEASICSNNISDGPITLHYVVFDKAGNSVASSVTGNVANNAPRIASLRVWSDFNENGNEDEGESDTKYYQGKERKVGNHYVTKATGATSEFIVSGNNNDYNNTTNRGSAFMTVKATTRFIPEIIGGNGALYYSYKHGTADTLGTAGSTYVAASIGEGTAHGIDEIVDDNGYYIQDENGSAYYSGRTDLYASTVSAADRHYMEIPGTVAGETENTYSLNMIGNSASATDPHWFEYTIYDSTDGSGTWTENAAGTAGRLSAKFRVALNLQYRDTTSPVVKIRPFYWNSKTDNSVSWDIDGNAEGHIELEGDLTNSIKTTTVTGTTTLGDDPKVSGVIKVEGYAFDDIKLKELYVQMSNHTSLAGSGTTGIKVADYTDGSWISVTPGADAGWSFAATDVYCNAEGHLVKWMLIVDTSTRTLPAQIDQFVRVYAVDARGSNDTNTSAHGGTTQTALTSYLWGNVKNQENALTTYYTDFYCNTNVTSSTSDLTVVYKESGKDSMTYYYKMDIVPYITEVTTGLSSFNRNKPSVYSRTAIGNYAVRAGESITIKGFNLKNSQNSVVTINGVNNSFTSTAASQSATAITGTVATAATSGSLELYAYDGTNKIYALNNKNENDSRGKAASLGSDNSNGYNRQPNGLNNNLLTDDVVLDVYEFKTVATPKNGSITDPFMRINPKTGQPGFSFNNAVLYFNMPGFEQTGTTTYSHTTFGADNGGYANGTFAWDANGNAFGIATCTDTGWPAESVSTVLFSKRSPTLNGNMWNTQQAYKNAIYQRGLESTTICLTQDQSTDATKYTTDTKRVMSPAIATKVSGTGNNATTTLYIAYYDRLTNQVRFRSGTVANDANTIGGALQDIFYRTTYSATYRGAPDSIYVDGSSKAGRDSDSTTITQDTVTGTSNGRIEIVASKSLGTGYLAAYQNNTTYGPGEHVDIGLSGDNVVITWYDSVNRKLMISYENPSSLLHDSAVATGTLARSGDWQSNAFEVEDTTGVGLYVKMAVDPAGGIHLAYYNNNGADLKYAYISQTDLTQKRVTKVQTIDSYLSAGARPTIDVTRVADTSVTGGYKYVPYIGYQMNSNLNTTASARVAYPYKFDSNGIAAGNGADNKDMFTGNWEVKTVPTQNTPIDAKVSAGVWTSGTNKVHTAIPSGTDTFENQSGTKTINAQATGQRAIIWGNGTLYPVISYAVSEDGKLEMAQQK